MHEEESNNHSSVNEKEAFEVNYGGKIKDANNYVKITDTLFDGKNSKFNQPYSKFGKFRYRW